MISPAIVIMASLLASDPGEVKVRSGPYVPKATATQQEKETAQQKIDRAVLSKDLLTGVVASIKLVPVPQGDQIRVETVVDAKELEFADRDGKSVQQLVFAVVLLDSKGELITGLQGLMDLALGAETLTDFRVYGLHASLTFPRPKSDYQVRVVVREAIKNQLGAWTLAGIK